MAPKLCGSSSALASLDASLQLHSRLAAQATRSFSATCRSEGISVNRWQMIQWFNRMGKRRFERQEVSYLGPFEDQPFPSNPLFRSQPVLSEAMRDRIYEQVMSNGVAIKAVSEEMGVDVRRIAAVLRLKEVENQWVTSGKKLATPYAKAVMRMLPQSEFHPAAKNVPHEPINDIPTHPYAMQQIFVPTAESRHFDRKDAAAAFHEHLRPIDERSPHRQLIKAEREILAEDGDRDASMERFRQRTQQSEDAFAAKMQKREDKAQWRLRKSVSTDRFEYRIKSYNAESVGKDGKAFGIPGSRYGAPLQDRKRGMVKIPTSAV